MRMVYRAQNPTDAYLLKGVLDVQGIHAKVQGEFLWSARGEVPIALDTSPSVWVEDEADYERAVQIVRDFQSQESSVTLAGEEWKCEKCGETNEAQFSECWNCGSEWNQREQD